MIKDNRIYFEYEGYENRFHGARRPALIRFSKKSIRGTRFNDEEEIDIVSLYIDGKVLENSLDYRDKSFRDPYAVVLVEPNQSSQRESSSFNIVARPFNPNSMEDWWYLFYDSSEFHRMGDGLAYAIIAVAFDKYNLNLQAITQAVRSFGEPKRGQVVELIKSATYGLSINKINHVNDLLRTLGNPSILFFPPILVDAAKQYEISYEDLCVHSLVDQIFKRAAETTIKRPRGFSRFIQWLNDDSISISTQELETCFAFLDESNRSLAIRRYFLDVKKGVLHYDVQSLSAFSSQNYKYYSTIRYIFEGWPGARNVSTEFLLDCLNTYEKTNQERFQVSNGILDWAVQKSIEVNRPIELNFNDWLCYCEGGILINPDFCGFANFEIKYELDDYAFENESIKNSITSLIDQFCEQLYHTEEINQIDPITGEPVINPKTNKIITIPKVVYEDRWRIRNKRDEEYLNLFVNWDKKPDTEPRDGVFTPEMIDYSIVRGNVENYLTEKYGDITPFVSERHPDKIVKMFAYEIGMRVIMYDDVTLGEDLGIDVSEVKQNMRNRMVELFGATLEREYDPSIYHRALVDSLFRTTGNSKQCFKKREKTYRWERSVYCAPKLAEIPNLLTGRKCADCLNDICFLTSIKKDPDWKKYTLIHILEIIGYKVLEDTEAGLIPNQVYNQFVSQINNAIRFVKRLICRECGHILFPAKKEGHSKYKCLMPSCTEYNKEVYLNFCYDCKKGIIDSRDTKQCPNHLYICPSCNSCCSNEYFEKQAEKYRLLGRRVPLFISNYMGNGHKDRHMVFCHKCGSQKVDYTDKEGHHELRCLTCNPIQESDTLPYEMIPEYGPIEDNNLDLDPWA